MAKSATKKAKKPASSPAEPTPPVEKQPQSKQAAAKQAGMFLFTDDKWSLNYFSDGDLHCEERELFG
jgi:hypothetical protein